VLAEDTLVASKPALVYLHTPTRCLTATRQGVSLHFLLEGLSWVELRYLDARVSIRTFAAGPDEAGFWPVIRMPSLIVRTPQFLTLE
jgi:hypothetical protein